MDINNLSNISGVNKNIFQAEKRSRGFVEMLCQILLEKRISIKMLVNKSGLSEEELRDIFKGTSDITLKQIAIISGAINIKTMMFVTDKP